MRERDQAGEDAQMEGTASIGRVDRRFDQRRSSGFFGNAERE